MPFDNTTGIFDSLAQPNLLDDPYPFYAWLQTHDPVHVDPDGTVYLSRYRDADLLKDPTIRDAPADDSRSLTLRTINQALIKAVPPRHARLRRVGATAFDRSMLDDLEPQMTTGAEALADRLLEQLRVGEADLHQGFTLPFTQQCAALVFGIPEDDVPMLSTLPSRMFGALYPRSTPESMNAADEASRTLLEYMDDAVSRRRFVPGSGFARLVEASVSTDTTVPVDETVRLCWMLWWASYTSVLAALDLAAITLLEHPQTSQTLHENPKRWVEEALRYRSPHVINSANLTTTHETVIRGTVVPSGTPVRFLIGAMNRDHEIFDQPDAFVPDRGRIPRHLAFGEGIHTCIGAQLARLEVAVALTTLDRRLPRLRLAGRPRWHTYTTQRLCAGLPVSVASHFAQGGR